MTDVGDVFWKHPSERTAATLEQELFMKMVDGIADVNRQLTKVNSAREANAHARIEAAAQALVEHCNTLAAHARRFQRSIKDKSSTKE